jgi:hypothetical protein
MAVPIIHEAGCHISIHHHPLAGLHALSAKLGDLLADAADRDYFYAPPRV